MHRRWDTRVQRNLAISEVTEFEFSQEGFFRPTASYQPILWYTIMIITTTISIEGKSIREYRGIVTGEAILGVNVFRDFLSSIRDIVGGRSTSYERELQTARSIALTEMSENARKMGANAVVGVDLDYEVIGKAGSMLMVAASGTAVTVE